MIRIREAIIVEVLEEKHDYQELLVKVEDAIAKAINYPLITGRAKENDLVYLNTTAVYLDLGTGGYHFVIAIKELGKNTSDHGHIMKMRYTPLQIKVLAVEEESSPYHELIKDFKNLKNIPVIIGFLHSMLIPALAGVRSINEKLKISYIMTDGGALPLAFSKTVKNMVKEKWLLGTLTSGHAFGGDLEAINIYSALAAAFTVHKPDLILVAMGPGNVGTGTELGTTAIEIGQIINAVSSLGGNPIVLPRISFQDKRNRHYGLSHHVVTVLNKIALAPCSLILPILKDIPKKNLLEQQVRENMLENKHTVIYENGDEGLEYLRNCGLNVTTMGRSFNEDYEFFLTACAGGSYAAKLV